MPPADLDALVRQLRAHASADAAEARDVARVLDFVARHPDPFDRRIGEGHLTGSAFVLTADGTRVLLLHHRKLDRWLQPGGHADPGERSGEAVALREVREETGLARFHLHPGRPAAAGRRRPRDPRPPRASRPTRTSTCATWWWRARAA